MRSWESHQDEDRADSILDWDGNADAINAHCLKVEHFVAEAQINIHAMDVAEHFVD